MKKSAAKTTAENLESRFEAGEEVLDYFDTETPVLSEPRMQRVSVEIPEWMARALDQEADRIGVTRTSVIKMWLAERLDEREEKRRAG